MVSARKATVNCENGGVVKESKKKCQKAVKTRI
jgi:hypothetical protein